MRYILYLFWFIVIVFGVTFSVLNAQSLNINYYIAQSTVQLPVILLISLVLGAALGVIAMLPIVLRAKNAARKLRNQVKHIEQEVTNLRTIPIKDSH